MHDYELLELLLTFPIPRKNVKPVAKKQIDELGGLLGVLDADQQQPEQLKGKGVITASLIRLVKIALHILFI